MLKITLLVMVPLASGLTVTVKTMVPEASAARVGVYQVGGDVSARVMGGAALITPPNTTSVGRISVMVTPWADEGPLLV